MIASFLMIIFYHSIYIEVITNTYSTLQSPTNEYMSVWTKESKQSSDRGGFTPANEKHLLLIPSEGVKCFKPEFFVNTCRPVYVSKSEAIRNTQGILPAEDFVRLMGVYTYKENLTKSSAMESICLKYTMKHPPPMPLHASFQSKMGIKCKAEKAAGERHTAYGMRTEDTDAIFA